MIVVALGCGGSAPVTPRRPAWLQSIKLEGNKAIEDESVVPHLALERTRKGGRAVDPYQLALDTERVRQAYVRKGYFEAKVHSRVAGETAPQRGLVPPERQAVALTFAASRR